MFRRDERRSACVCDSSGNPLRIHDDLQANNTIKLYPNPAFDKLYVELENNSKTEQVALYNSVGMRINTSVIIRNNKATVDLTDLPPGIYSVVCIQKKNSVSKVFRKL
ncbi:MAG TPA: T9SS type A sorting domain-containing protein [Flavipsychrobacter sp.]|nr:T9SS type A sorting domain-containing protein [Flavipsychrobacter sp.]